MSSKRFTKEQFQAYINEYTKYSSVGMDLIEIYKQDAEMVKEHDPLLSLHLLDIVNTTKQLYEYILKRKEVN